MGTVFVHPWQVASRRLPGCGRAGSTQQAPWSAEKTRRNRSLEFYRRLNCKNLIQQVVVQVVIIADDTDIRDKLADHGFHVQTVAEVAPIEVQPARVLSHLYTYLGRNKKLGLTGRKSRDVGILSTSKLYSLKDRIFAFTPQVNIL